MKEVNKEKVRPDLALEEKKKNFKMPALSYRGSVKDVHLDEENLKGYFAFSDSFSIFDWGKMPNNLREKGMALALMAKYFFLYFENKTNIQTHFRNYHRPNILEVSACNITRPKWDDQEKKWIYLGEKSHLSKNRMDIIPLEVIFRFGLPKGSSLLKRLQENLPLKNSLGLDHEKIEEGQLFSRPILEFSTKLEPEDRLLGREEALNISGLFEDEFRELEEKTIQVGFHLQKIFEDLNVILWDGKLEWGAKYIEGAKLAEIILIDSIGPDELRLSYKGQLLSKEFLRQLYKKSSWYENIKLAKSKAKLVGERNWKSLCKERPEILGNDQIKIAEMIYKTFAQQIGSQLYDENPFPNALNLEDLCQELIKFN